MLVVARDAALAQAIAEVAQAVANQGKTEADERRQTQLLQNKIASQQDFDNAVQANLAAKAVVEAARAAEKQAALNVEYATITSPVDGIVGRTDLEVEGKREPPQTNAPEPQPAR